MKKLWVGVLLFVVLLGSVYAYTPKYTKTTQISTSLNIKDLTQSQFKDDIISSQFRNIQFPIYQCVDSDGGRSPYIRGAASAFPNDRDCAQEYEEFNLFCREFPSHCSLNLISNRCRIQSGYDSCVSANTVKEYYCGSDGSLKSRYYSCEHGCYQGACRTR